MTNVTVSETVFNVTVAETNQNVTAGQTGDINVSVNATDLATTISQPFATGVEVLKSLSNNTLTARKLRSSGNDVSLAQNTDDIDITLSDTITVDLNGNLKATTTNIAGHLIPETDDTHDLGSTTKRFRDLYLGPGSLFINNQKVLEDDSGVIKISSTNNLSVEAGGDLTLLSTNNTSTLQDTTINLGPSANNGTVNIRGLLEAPDLHVGDLEFTASTIDQTTTNQNLTVSTTGTGFTHLKTADVFIGAGTPDASGEFVQIDENSIKKFGTGSLTVTGNLTGTVTGTVSDISNHLLDEDNFASDSATKAPSQQSVKAYIATQIATKDNTDEITEGSSNLYFTNSRADARITAASLFDLSDVSGSHGAGKLLVNTGSAFSATTVNTDNFSEGSSNLFHTSARAIAAVEGEATLDLSGTVTVTGSASTKNTVIGDATVGGSFAQHGFTVNAGDTCWAGVNLRETTGGAGKPINNFSNPTFGATVFGGTEASKTGVESGKRLVVVQGLASQDGTEPTTANARFMFETTQQQTGSARGSRFVLDTCADDSTSTTTSLVVQGNVLTISESGNGTLKSGGDLTLDDNVIVTGTTDLQGNLLNSTGDVTVDDNLKVNSSLTVDGNTQLGNANTDTITATAKLTTQNGLVLTSLNVATANTLAGLGVIDEGSIIYCTDGDSGSKCIAIYDGSNWKRISLGANISSS